MCSEFLYNFTWNISHSKKNTARYCHNFRNVFTYCKLYSSRILMKFEFSRQIFEEGSHMKSYQHPSSGSRVVPCGRTDMTKLIAPFRNSAKAPKNCRKFKNKLYERWLSKVQAIFLFLLKRKSCRCTIPYSTAELQTAQTKYYRNNLNGKWSAISGPKLSEKFGNPDCRVNDYR